MPQGPVRLAVVTSPVDAQVVFSQIEATNDVGRALEGLAAAGLGSGHSGRRETKQGHRAKLNQGRNHAYV